MSESEKRLEALIQEAREVIESGKQKIAESKDVIARAERVLATLREDQS